VFIVLVGVVSKFKESSLFSVYCPTSGGCPRDGFVVRNGGCTIAIQSSSIVCVVVMLPFLSLTADPGPRARGESCANLIAPT